MSSSLLEDMTTLHQEHTRRVWLLNLSYGLCSKSPRRAQVANLVGLFRSVWMLLAWDVHWPRRLQANSIECFDPFAQVRTAEVVALVAGDNT